MIALIGIDGSGKTTVIAELQIKLSALGKGVWVVQNKYKPRKTAVIRNHDKPARSALQSAIKLLLRAAKWWVYFQFTLRPKIDAGGLVLCDRFYFDDLLVDPLKYRYGGPVWLAAKIRSLLPGPDVYILLDAPAEICFARKQEVELEEMTRQRQSFQTLVAEQADSYTVDASAPLTDVVAKTYEIVLKHLREEDRSHSASARSTFLT